ncbi:MAG TPA: hypothetical protein VF698_07945 [Thermoanaerobaculia bacterium]|jgi:hypothetical protein
MTAVTTATKRLALAVALTLTVAIPAHADFGSLARAVSNQPGVSRVWMPFLGLARAAVWVVSPKGVHDFQLAMFRGNSLGDGKRFGELIRRHAGNGFRPLVQVRERKGSWSYIYARPTTSGDRLELIVFTHDGPDETVLVRVEVDPHVVARELGRPNQMAGVLGR